MHNLGELLAPLLEADAIARGWIDAELPEELRGQGFIGYRDLDGLASGEPGEPGKILAVLPLLFGRARLTYGNGPKAVLTHGPGTDWEYTVPLGYDGGCDTYWDFDTPEAAIEAMRSYPHLPGVFVPQGREMTL